MTIISADKLVSQTPDAVNWLVPERLIAGGLNLLAGEVAAGKTFLALDLALGAAVRAEAWGGLSVPTGKVLYYCLDSSATTIGHRLKNLCNGYAIDPPPSLHFDFEMHDLSKSSQINVLKNLIQSEGFHLVIIDALARYLPGMDENTVASIGPVLTRLRRLTDDTGSTILLLHHFNKGGNKGQSLSQGMRIRGSSDIFAAVDTALTLVMRGALRILRMVKNRNGREAAPLSFLLTEDEDGAMRLDFSEPQDAEPEVDTVSELTMSLILKIMRAKAGNYFTRNVLEDLLGDYGPVPSERTLDKVFAQLPDQPGVEVVRKSYYKYYGYFGDDGQGMGGQELSAEEQEAHEQKVARAKEMLKKLLLPKLEEMRKKAGG